jgi:hypothetical protein
MFWRYTISTQAVMALSSLTAKSLVADHHRNDHVQDHEQPGKVVGLSAHMFVHMPMQRN